MHRAANLLDVGIGEELLCVVCGGLLEPEWAERDVEDPGFFFLFSTSL